MEISINLNLYNTSAWNQVCISVYDQVFSF